MAQIFDKTPWKLETSEESSVSIFVGSWGGGKLYFENEQSGEKFNVSYIFFGAGTSKGFSINYSESLKTDPSGGFSNVKVLRGFGFGPSTFPCAGRMVITTATAGIFQPSFISHSGLSVCVASFGFIPFGGITFWGRFNSIMPSAGPSVAACHFSI